MLLRSGVVAGVLTMLGVGGWFAFGSDCDGAIVRNSWQCVRNAGFDPSFCNRLYDGQETRISRAPANFATESACRSQFDNCEKNRQSSWSAKPTAYCVVRAKDGGIARYSPAT